MISAIVVEFRPVEGSHAAAKTLLFAASTLPAYTIKSVKKLGSYQSVKIVDVSEFFKEEGKDVPE